MGVSLANPKQWVTPGTPEIQWLAAELGSPQAIYEFMANVRYVPGFRMQKPLETLNSLEGDCDDQACLLASLLRSIGEKAYVRVAEIPGSPFLHAWVVWFDVAWGVWRNLDPSGTVEFTDLGYGDMGGVNIRQLVDFNDEEIFDYGGLNSIASVFS